MWLMVPTRTNDGADTEHPLSLGSLEGVYILHEERCMICPPGRLWALILSRASVVGNTSHASSQLHAGRTQGSVWLYWERTVRSFLQTSPSAPDPFTGFALYPSFVINYSRDYNYMISSMNH